MATQHFFLQQPNPDDGYIFFCNLVGSPWEPEVVAVGASNATRGGIIAHDLLEHTQYHRKRAYVPWTEELKAFGTAVYIRGCDIDINVDFRDAVESITQNILDIPPVPYTYRALCKENPLGLEISELLEKYDEIYHTDVQNVADQINYGYIMRMDTGYPYDYGDFQAVKEYFQKFHMDYDTKRQYFIYCPKQQRVIPTRTIMHF